MMSHIFPRHCKQNLPQAASGDGCYIIDNTGKRYFDGSGGAAVSCLGHSNQRVADAIKSQLDKIAFGHTGFFTSAPAEELADLLVRQSKGVFERVYFVSGGSEAVEAALKLARQYHLENGEAERRHIIARRQSYHGNTLGALAAGGNQWRRAQFEPLLVEMSHIAPCYAYIDQRADETAFEYGQRIANELEEEICRLGPKSVAAFIAEPVVGATLGAVPAVEGYYSRIREICTQYGVLLILDEVMCGMGRTGHLFAYEAEQITPDILCIAKGLGAGYQPIGAMLTTATIYDAIANGSGFFQHGHTYIGHPVATAGAAAVLSEIIDNDLTSKVAQNGLYIEKELRRKFGQHPIIGDIRGRGHFWGLEFVHDKDKKTPLAPEMGFAGRLKKNAFNAGLICYPMPGTRDGKNGDHVLLAPPFIADEADIDSMIDILFLAIDQTMASLSL